MFVCIEVETEDITIWKEIDNILAQEFGLTHTLWGVKAADKTTPTTCKLPSNLFYGAPTTPETQLSDLIKDRLRHFNTSFRLIAIDNSWAYRKYENEALTSSVIVADEQEITVREA